jgi:hypothetical protein
LIIVAFQGLSGQKGLASVALPPIGERERLARTQKTLAPGIGRSNARILLAEFLYPSFKV